MRQECRERFFHHRALAIPTCITARAWGTCRDPCRGRLLAVSFEMGGGENVPGIPGACATRIFTYLIRGPWSQYSKRINPQSSLSSSTALDITPFKNIIFPFCPMWYLRVCLGSHIAKLALGDNLLFIIPIPVCLVSTSPLQKPIVDTNFQFVSHFSLDWIIYGFWCNWLLV